MTTKKILIVDDEPDILEFLSYNLKKENYKVYTASNGKEAIAKALQHHPDLILLDIMMPEMDGIETCAQIREHKALQNSYIVFLSARGEEFSQLAAYNVGADDFIQKPIKPKILIAKLNSIFKRSRKKEELPTIIEIGPFTLNREHYRLVMNDKEIPLPRKEFELLALLMSKPSKVFKREEILSSVWGENIIVGDRTIDVHIRKLREKIGEKYIKTIKGVGYKFEEH